MINSIQLNNPSGGASVPLFFRESSSDKQVIQQIFANQDYSLVRLQLNKEINDFLAAKRAQGLRPLIIDLGANIGASALYFLLTYPQARVIAVEPDQSNIELLTLNTKGFDCITVKGAAASEKVHARLYDPSLGHWGLRTIVDKDGELETYTVPELLKTYGSDKSLFPFLIKIDIEGAEAELFSQDTGWFDEFPVAIIELHDWILPGENNSRNFLKCVSALARDFVFIGENVFSIKTPMNP